jgi:acyl-coenzyme A synthetase/AMP-(fatty) acid ligase
MLRAYGMWISPFEIESALLAHPDVRQAAVVAVPDLQGLPRLRAFVILRPGVEGRPELAEQLKSWLRERLAHFKCPHQIEFRSELPMTSTGKIQRFKLREEAQPG